MISLFMKSRKNYASKLTKDELIKSGITDITTDGRVFKGEAEVWQSTNNHGYKTIHIYDRDEDGNIIKTYNKKKGDNWFGYKTYVIGVHRAMWAWYNNEVPAGMVVDHINNIKTDNRLTNLQLLTPKQNILKSKPESYNGEKLIKCNTSKPITYYEDKLYEIELAYSQAKEEHNAELAHLLRSKRAYVQGQIRYYNKFLQDMLLL